ncbi:hypothetical protein BC938DRAFT_480686 [Jimgerdemannia flammicorona]|uniref:Uncharacterized protein n=1 Tax=Jimgerdemannia flammicorona TaxID=994334 RepID=A0A433QX99_9FUNG|nr:hypothetical protein BC938DRAFT_480686 [Jimgerdemannia flammicorona]
MPKEINNRQERANVKSQQRPKQRLQSCLETLTDPQGCSTTKFPLHVPDGAKSIAEQVIDIDNCIHPARLGVRPSQGVPVRNI